ncbi:MFS general substrate transporter [Glarea lozoyensis ATCC 20868]|uniref:MFS general substrate transporter n=1 Tax=Glarea lozoyensis (strain ATCC 20868 / MF5171) TaxID=1116229 RepID=S3CD64_GLAL2|nr:MFS general substrate transporter [Glarea lozoyensis ATCC 20868]EPE24482.1 MFS general substrate transporter [Glarea lozoyensis ATCC 20868]
MTTIEEPEHPPKHRFLRVSRSFFSKNSVSNGNGTADDAVNENLTEESAEKGRGRPTTKWSLGVLNVPSTHEVPGSVMLLSDDRNHPLGLRHTPAVTSSQSLPAQVQSRRSSHQETRPDDKKKTDDGMILDPQPEDVDNDPLNWPQWRRDAALLSLGLYCMVGGGMTPILAAGFSNVAETYDVSVPQVALTTGLYMMGLGVGSVIFSPTAILYGKRPVYLFCAIMFVGTSVWCAASPTYISLLVARIFQGISISSVECLPSATIAEIFFLHERAYRIGIYTLLLLGGKNLVPLVSAAIIQSMGWRWVFWIVAMVVGFCGVLLFFFVPESFWDRTPHGRHHKPAKSMSRLSVLLQRRLSPSTTANASDHRNRHNGNSEEKLTDADTTLPQRPLMAHRATARSVGFAENDQYATDLGRQADGSSQEIREAGAKNSATRDRAISGGFEPHIDVLAGHDSVPRQLHAHHDLQHRIQPAGDVPATPILHNMDSPYYVEAQLRDADYAHKDQDSGTGTVPTYDGEVHQPAIAPELEPHSKRYTNVLRRGEKLSFVQQLKPYNGRLSNDSWLRVAFRPFILFAYPAVLWSSVVYACAVGWLIVLSESVSEIYRNAETYNFSALSTGLIYISPFIGGILGTAVAGKVSDMIVKRMTKRNGGLYEPEFRLVMGIPITITTVIGLMGYGWSAHEHDAWIVPTIFFGIISFGCSLASTTSITFCVDSYRQYAGEALVTLNFSKNIFHGLVFSLFFNHWLEADGSRTVFIWLGVIQLIFMASTIPMYIFGKRARMWTVRMNLMERF